MVDIEKLSASKLSQYLSSPNRDVQWKVVNNPNFSKEHAFLFLRNRNLHPEIIEELASRKELMKLGGIRFLITVHPRTPLSLALNMVPTLQPMETVRVISDPYAKPAVKQKAEQKLKEELASMPLGLKISIARIAPPRIHPLFFKERDERVLKAFLENPKLKEETVLWFLEEEDLPPFILQHLYSRTRWGLLYRVKFKIAKHPSTPIPVVLRILNELLPEDLEEIVKDPRQPDVVLRRIKALLGRE